VPAIRSVRRLTAVGTPPPSSSSSVPTTTTYTFSGPIPGTTYALLPPGACFSRNSFTFVTDLSSLGQSSVSVDICFGQPIGLQVPVNSGTFSLSAAQGSISGILTGGITGPVDPQNPQNPVPAHIDIAITAGDGAFADATGTAAIDAQFQLLLFVISGGISGTFDVPS